MPRVRGDYIQFLRANATIAFKINASAWVHFLPQGHRGTEMGENESMAIIWCAVESISNTNAELELESDPRAFAAKTNARIKPIGPANPARRRLAPPVSNTLRHEPQDSNWMRTVPVSQSLVLCPIGENQLC